MLKNECSNVILCSSESCNVNEQIRRDVDVEDMWFLRSNIANTEDSQRNYQRFPGFGRGQ